MANIVCFGEILLRLSAPGKHRLEQAGSLTARYVGAEANVAVDLARLKRRTSFVSALPDNPLGEAARSAMMAHGVTVEAPSLPDSRLGVYYFESGAGARPSSIVYDRKHSAFATCAPDQYDWRRLLKDTDWLHLSGISLALSETARRATFEAAECAAELNVPISFDCNFRASLWKGREKDAALVIRDLARFATLVFGGAMDAQMLFDLPCSDGAPLENFRRASEKFMAFSPTLALVASTNRSVESADSNILSGFIADRQNMASAQPVHLTNIADRIGAGDAFAAGVLHKCIDSASLQETVDFAIASAAVKHTIPGDFNLTSEEEIEAFGAGANDVKR